MTGSGVAASMFAFPDVGLVMLMEMVDQARNIVSAVNIPVIADADTGYGNALNVRRTVKEYENIGVSGIHLEDQKWPKKCGQFEGKRLISKEEMVHKIRAAIDARLDPNFVIIARTDAIGVEGFNQAIDRGQAYSKAGADMIFLDALSSMDQIDQVPNCFDKPVLINMDFGRKTPWVHLQDLDKAGYKLVIYPGLPQLTALNASRNILRELNQTGTITRINEHLAYYDDFMAITNLDEATTWENKYDI